MRARLICGAGLWSLRPAYLIVELVVAGRATGDYSVVDDSVSQLGAVGCSSRFCSPGHELMNGTFVGVGLLLAAGALLLASRIGPVATVLLVLAGLSSVATGLAPVDQDGVLHALAATPLFVCQPVALLVLAWALWPDHSRVAATLSVTGLVTGAAAIGFVLAGDSGGGGVLERMALWPVLVALPAVAVVSFGPPRRAQRRVRPS